MITSDTQQIEQLIQELREPCTKSVLCERLMALRQMCLALVNDRADARELADDRLLAGNRLLTENVHYYGIVKQQEAVLAEQSEFIAKLTRRQETIRLTVTNLDAPAWVKINALRLLFEG